MVKSNALESYEVFIKSIENETKNLKVKLLKQAIREIVEKTKSVKDTINYELTKTQSTEIIIEDINNTLVKINRYLEELNEPFLLFIVGSGKFGKSTLVNALLGKGEPKAEMNFLPKTWKIDVFFASKENKVKIYYTDGSEKKMSVENAQKLIEKEEFLRKKSEQEIRELFNKNKQNLKSIEAKKEYKNKLEKEYLYKTKVSEVHWPRKKNRLLEKFRIVDTPGVTQKRPLGDDLFKTATDYYGKADGVVWLLSSDVIADRNSKKEIEDLLKMYGDRKENIIAAMNKKDLIIKNSGKEGLERIKKEAHKIYGNIFEEIVPISAKMAYENYEKDEILYNESGMPELLEIIDERFYKNAQQIQYDAKKDAVKTEINILKEKILKNKEKILKNYNIYLSGKEELLENQEKIKEIFYNSVKVVFEDHMKRVTSRLVEKEDILWNLDEYERNSYLEKSVFINNELEQTLTECLKSMQKMIEKNRALYLQKAMFNEYPILAKNNKELTNVNKFISSKISVNSSIDTESGSLAVAGLLSLGGLCVFGPLGLLAGAFGGSDFFKSFAKGISRFFTNLPKKISNNYGAALYSQLDVLVNEANKYIDNIAIEINNVRAETFTELYLAPNDIQKFNDLNDIIEKLEIIEDYEITKEKLFLYK